MIAVILAGGKGLRLWPESRKQRPKQLCSLLDQRTMLDHTMDRLFLSGTNKMIIITSQDLVEVIEKTVHARPDAHLVEIHYEPELKNTAPAIGLILAKCWDENRSEIIGIFPADHHIGDNDLFQESLDKAVRAAEAGHLVTIGITPTRPETGYGYIERSKWEISHIPEVFGVQAFQEKPALELAETYYQDGQHLWNAGIYIGHTQTFYDEFAEHLPHLYEHILQGYDHYLTAYPYLPEISFDYGIAEKSQRIAVVPSTFPWCDLGSWNSMGDLYPADQGGNIKIGSNILALSSHNCVIKQKDKNIVLFGADDLLVVETEDVIFVTPKNRSQDIREVVEALSAEHVDLL